MSYRLEFLEQAIQSNDAYRVTNRYHELTADEQRFASRKINRYVRTSIQRAVETCTRSKSAIDASNHLDGFDSMKYGLPLSPENKRRLHQATIILEQWTNL